MSVLKSLFLSAAVAVAVLGTTENAKACDAFFPAGQAFAFSNGGFAYGQSAFFAPQFVPSYGYGFRQSAFFAPAVRQNVFVQQRSPSINVVQEQRGLFGRVRSRQVVQIR